MRFAASMAFAAAALIATAAQAQTINVKIGVLTDMSSLYADDNGAGSVAAAKMAVQDFNPAAHGMKVDIVSADHQNKPDIGSNIARQWFDVDGVDAIVDVPNSGVALAVSEVAREKNKVLLVSGAAISDLTGPKCSPNTVHWTYDTWMLAHSTAGALGENRRRHLVFPHRRLCLRPCARARRHRGRARQWRQGARQREPSAQQPGLLVVPAAGASNRKPRSSGSPMPAATPSTPSSRAPNSASPPAGSTSRRCCSTSATSKRSG